VQSVSQHGEYGTAHSAAEVRSFVFFRLTCSSITFMALLCDIRSSRELSRQKSYDRVEMREMRDRLLSSESAPGHSSVNYGSVNPAFARDKDDTANLVNTILFPFVLFNLCKNIFNIS